MKKKTAKILIAILSSAILIICIVAGVFVLQINSAKKEVKNKIESLPANYEKYADDYLLNEINEYESLMDAKTIKKIAEDLTLFSDGKAFYRQNAYPTIYFYTVDSKGKDLTKEDNYVPTQVVFVGNNGQVVNDVNGKIKVRGNSTADAEKKPYNFKFDKAQDLFGFGESKKWSLLAECLDPTMLRNKLFFTLAKEMGMDYVSDSEYVMVYVDDVYEGAYLLAETADVSPSRLDINLENGDLAFEYEAEREDEEATYLYTEHGWRFVANDPEFPTEDDMERFLGTVYNFDDVAYTFDYDYLCSFIDVNNFAKYYLLNEFAKNIDFDYSSVKFYKKNGVVYVGPVWDFDLSSGNYSLSYHYEAYIGDTMEEKEELMDSYSGRWCYKNLVFDALTHYPDFMSLVEEYYDEYKDLLKSTYQDGGHIDQIVNGYKDLFDTNYRSVEEGGAGWSVSKTYSQLEKERYATYEENLQYLKDWLKNRIDYFEEYGFN